MGEDVKFEKLASRSFEFKFAYFGSETAANLKPSYNKYVFCFHSVVNLGYVGLTIWKTMHQKKKNLNLVEVILVILPLDRNWKVAWNTLFKASNVGCHEKEIVLEIVSFSFDMYVTVLLTDACARLGAWYMKTMQWQLSIKFNFSVHKVDCSCMFGARQVYFAGCWLKQLVYISLSWINPCF